MLSKTKIIFLVGITLTLVGSFLPWRQEGDFIYYLTYGVRIFPRFEDNGGLLIVFLTLLLIALVLRPLNFIINSSIWIILFSVSLVFASAVNLARVLSDGKQAAGIIGAPQVGIGLYLVCSGALFLLFSALLNNSRSS